MMNVFLATNSYNPEFDGTGSGEEMCFNKKKPFYKLQQFSKFKKIELAYSRQ